MSAVVVGVFAVSGTEEYINLSVTLAILVGALFVIAGLLKLESGEKSSSTISESKLLLISWIQSS
jgi:hypothetical protein